MQARVSFRTTRSRAILLTDAAGVHDKLASSSGKPADPSILGTCFPKLLTADYELRPDRMGVIPEQRFVFGTSGPPRICSGRGFNEWHILSITQAIWDYRNPKTWTVRVSGG